MDQPPGTKGRAAVFTAHPNALYSQVVGTPRTKAQTFSPGWYLQLRLKVSLYKPRPSSLPLCLRHAVASSSPPDRSSSAAAPRRPPYPRLVSTPLLRPASALLLRLASAPRSSSLERTPSSSPAPTSLVLTGARRAFTALPHRSSPELSPRALPHRRAAESSPRCHTEARRAFSERAASPAEPCN